MTHSDPVTAGWTRDTCEANGIHLHYLRTGGDKPPLIALHGLSGSGACWTPVARALENDFDVIMPDARGHGRSSAPPGGYAYRDHARDVLGLIEALALTDPVLLGHSMGGMTAAVVASQLGSAVRGVVLADPTFISPEWQREVYESDVAEQHQQLLGEERSVVLAQTRQRHPQRSEEMIELLTEARFQTRVQAFEVLVPPNPEYHELVRSIRAPMLLVMGSRGVVSLDTAQNLQALNPLLRSDLMADVGHGLPYDQPEQLARLVQSFVGPRVADESGT
ncbi:alpha/beta hydrolase [Deinococcus sonorensis]|uniref:Alpha/beta hydrolase n=2 Tax=Deinococcus sonorensis TaxID=309891 RepID=A0AAU7UCR9_9DEIO